MLTDYFLLHLLTVMVVLTWQHFNQCKLVWFQTRTAHLDVLRTLQQEQVCKSQVDDTSESKLSCFTVSVF